MLRIYLFIPTNSKKQTTELQNNIINLLTNMPGETYSYLIGPKATENSLDEKYQFEGENMTAFYTILMFLQDKFTTEETVCFQL